FSESDHPHMEVQPSALVICYPKQKTTSLHRFESLRFWREMMVAEACDELPRRTLELAAAVGETVRRITVRDQKSRWGSCSSRTRSISLNWRCILFPDDVRDYLMYHELAHLRHANHSDTYWRLVAHWC